MTKQEAIESILTFLVSRETDAPVRLSNEVSNGTGYYCYDTTHGGYSDPRYLGDSPEQVCHRYGGEIQFLDHGAGRKSVQLFLGLGERKLVRDLTYSNHK